MRATVPMEVSKTKLGEPFAPAIYDHLYADIEIAIGSSCVCSSIAELLAVLMAEETQENELVEEEEVTQIPGAI